MSTLPMPEETTQSIVAAAFAQAQKDHAPKAEEAPTPEPTPTPEPESEEPKPESAKPDTDKAEDQVEYSAEDLDKMSKELGAKAADELDEEKLKSTELVEKKKAMDRIFDAKMKEINGIFGDMRKGQDELRQALEAVNKQREKYKELVGEDAEEDPKIKELSERQASTDRQTNWLMAERNVKEIFPDFGLYDDAEMTKSLQDNPDLLELAQVGNGRFGTLVLAAAHYLTQRKPENWSKIIANELETNYKEHTTALDKVLQRRIDELKARNEKKKSITQVAKKSEAAVLPLEKPKMTGRESPGDIFRGEMMDLLAHPEKLKT